MTGRGWFFYALPWLQTVGLAAALVLLWWSVLQWDFSDVPGAARVVVAAILVCLAVSLTVWTWRRVGGYTAYWSLRQWVRGGSFPSEVSAPRRLRFLKPLADIGSGSGWLYLGLAALYLAFAIGTAFGSLPRALGHLIVAAVWAIGGITRVRLTRRWGERITDLYNETVIEVAGPSTVGRLTEDGDL